MAIVGPAAVGEVVQKRDVRVSVVGGIAPSRLPRRGAVPVAVTLGGHIAPVRAGTQPQLRRLTVLINRHGHLDARGIPKCRLGQIEPSTTAEALAACGRALIGQGRFSADVEIPEQSPFPSKGKVLAFNGRFEGKPAVLAHVYGREPVPTSYVLPFVVERAGGRFGTKLVASLPSVTGNWGFVTGLVLTLEHQSPGGRHSYLSAGCPAPAGFSAAVFPLTRTVFAFAGGLSVASTLTKTCQVEQ